MIKPMAMCFKDGHLMEAISFFLEKSFRKIFAVRFMLSTAMGAGLPITLHIGLGNRRPLLSGGGKLRRIKTTLLN